MRLLWSLVDWKWYRLTMLCWYNKEKKPLEFHSTLLCITIICVCVLCKSCIIHCSLLALSNEMIQIIFPGKDVFHYLFCGIFNCPDAGWVNIGMLCLFVDICRSTEWPGKIMLVINCWFILKYEYMQPQLLLIFIILRFNHGVKWISLKQFYY